MIIDDAIEIIKPDADSHFRLRPCRRCKSDNAAYVKYLDKGHEFWRVDCLGCGHSVKPRGAVSRHDVQIQWNGVQNMPQCSVAPACAARCVP